MSSSSADSLARFFQTARSEIQQHPHQPGGSGSGEDESDRIVYGGSDNDTERNGRNNRGSRKCGVVTVVLVALLMLAVGIGVAVSFSSKSRRGNNTAAATSASAGDDVPEVDREAGPEVDLVRGTSTPSSPSGEQLAPSIVPDDDFIAFPSPVTTTNPVGAPEKDDSTESPTWSAASTLSPTLGVGDTENEDGPNAPSSSAPTKPFKQTPTPPPSVGTTTASPTIATVSPTLPPSLPPPSLVVEPFEEKTTLPPTQKPTVHPTPGPPTAAPAQEDDDLASSSSTSLLLDCLEQVATQHPLVIVEPGDSEFAAATVCLVYLPGSATPPTRVVVRPGTPPALASVVQCANLYQTTVSARSGAHSFTGDACRGTIIADLSELDSIEVLEGGGGGDNDNNKLVRFGAGQLHGHLYYHLATEHQLVVSGGTELPVGVGGLWLGCGRGLWTQIYGYSCDTLVEIEYVDATGSLRTANANQNEDIFWMARGAGGDLFPGITTKFTARAFPAPASAIYKEACYYSIDFSKAVLRAFTNHLEEINDPSRGIFSVLVSERTFVRIDWVLLGPQ